MEILKDGKIPDTRKDFRCSDCGCVFRAEKGEWKAHTGEYQSVDYVCTCPCCGKTVHGGKPVE